MSVKILHAADFHLDSPFEALPEDKAASRRREQRDLLDRLADLANAEKVDLVLLAGDLLDSARSYYETQEALTSALSRIAARVFIAPGNHDYYCPKSPYAYVRFPENVHIFTSPVVASVTLPDLGCRVWGAAFNDAYSRPLLPGFRAPGGEFVEIMVMHGDMSGDAYNRVREADIAASGLDYLALGHIHAFSGVRSAGKTSYAYPGCPEGRGFDETGEKGVIVGTIGKGGCDLEFRPLHGRSYRVVTVDLTGSADPLAAVEAALPIMAERDIVKVVLTGECASPADLGLLNERLAGRFFHTVFQDFTRPPRDIWAAAGDDTLRGIFLRRLKEKYDQAASDDEQKLILAAVRYGLAALDNREEFEAW